MKGKLLIDGKEIEVEISEEEYKKLQTTKKENKTGYERIDGHYYYIEGLGNVLSFTDTKHETDDLLYETANYYSSKDVAENNARADQLMRQLRRFAAEHRENELDWNDVETAKFRIAYDSQNAKLKVERGYFLQSFGNVYFDSEKATEAAMDEFKDELIWYFTEYQDSL